MTSNRPTIHEDQQVVTAGARLEEAAIAMIMVHGRGATARDILTLINNIQGDSVAYLAPQAAHNNWYPYSFLAPITQNEPFLSSALSTLDGLLERVSATGISADKTLLLGFSQGACLATEYAVRNPRPYGAIICLSGGLIGPPGTPRNYDGRLNGAPAFLGCSDVDPHIPVERVHETEEVLRKMGSDVTKRLYPGMGHLVNEDEIEFVQALLDAVAGRASDG